ncbi:unnamed protein product [Paramecium sonneborni]|uniref:Uncharacterized protein n=1 Tax=Paramecium sonneborni TaxID=65129 RepID=A0A8S1M8N7_9CILI|nr:unnamed protein product [Paramecium sonneborni]
MNLFKSKKKEEPKKKLTFTIDKLNILFMTAKEYINHDKQKKTNEAMQQENKLISMLKAPQRNRKDEEVQIIRIVNLINTIEAYEKAIIQIGNIDQFKSQIVSSQGDTNKVLQFMPYIASVCYYIENTGDIRGAGDLKEKMNEYYGCDIANTFERAVDPNAKLLFGVLNLQSPSVQKYAQDFSKKYQFLDVPGLNYQLQQSQQSLNPNQYPQNPLGGSSQNFPQQGGSGYPQQGGGYPQQGGGYTQQKGAYPQQGGIYPQQGGYPQQQGGYPQQQGGYPQQQGGYPQQQGGYPQQQGGYPQQQGGYPSQQGGYPQQQSGYPQQQGGYPQQGSSYPQQGGGQAQQNMGYQQQQQINQSQQQSNYQYSQNNQQTISQNNCFPNYQQQSSNPFEPINRNSQQNLYQNNPNQYQPQISQPKIGMQQKQDSNYNYPQQQQQSVYNKQNDLSQQQQFEDPFAILNQINSQKMVDLPPVNQNSIKQPNDLQQPNNNLNQQPNNLLNQQPNNSQKQQPDNSLNQQLNNPLNQSRDDGLQNLNKQTSIKENENEKFISQSPQNQNDVTNIGGNRDSKFIQNDQKLHGTQLSDPLSSQRIFETTTIDQDMEYSQPIYQEAQPQENKIINHDLRSLEILHKFKSGFGQSIEESLRQLQKVCLSI